MPDNTDSNSVNLKWQLHKTFMALVDDRIGNTASNNMGFSDYDEKTIGVFNNEETKSHMTSDDTDKFQNDKRLTTRKSSEDHVTKIIDEKTRRRP